METPKDRLLRGHVTPARDALAGSADKSQRVGMGSALGAPDDGRCRCSRREQGVQVRAIVGKLAVNGGLGAIEASLQSVRGADEDVQGCQGVAKRRGEHVCRAELRPWYEAGDLGFSRVVACVSRLLCDFSDGVVPTRSLTERATGGVESASVQEARVACGTHYGLLLRGTTQMAVCLFLLVTSYAQRPFVLNDHRVCSQCDARTMPYLDRDDFLRQERWDAHIIPHKTPLIPTLVVLLVECAYEKLHP